MHFGAKFSCGGPDWKVDTFVRTTRVLVERHVGKCDCSYCQKCRWPVALWLPENRSWNSWRVVAFRVIRSRWYVLWTLKRPPSVNPWIPIAIALALASWPALAADLPRCAHNAPPTFTLHRCEATHWNAAHDTLICEARWFAECPDGADAEARR